jgi:beta-galactosidase
LGAAAFDRAEERKAQLLKAAGFNSVRTAHNPPSAAFLDACDRIGLLVLDEPFDVWTESKRTFDYARFFNEWWQRDIDAMVLRDRNHPSVILWGIGNEIPEVWTAKGVPIAKELSNRIRSLDSTRPLTQAFPGATYGSDPDAAIAQVDIAGYNYNLAQNQAEDHRRVPERIMMTTESFPADAFEQWKLVQEHPYTVGEFVWTSMDYLGESGIGAWSYGTAKLSAQTGQMKNFLRTFLAKMGDNGKNPAAAFQNGQPPSPMTPGFPWHAAYCGDLDLTGFRKPSSYYRDILWNGGNRVFMTVRLPETDEKKILAPGWAIYPTIASWTWPGQERKSMQVEVYAGTERVRLFLNDKLVGEMPTTVEQQRKAVFTVAYEKGPLRAVGINGNREVVSSTLETATEPVRLKLTADRARLQADGEDLSFISVEAVDASGRLQPNASQEVQFQLNGPATIAAVGSGDGANNEPYRSDHIALFNGRAIVVVRSSRTPGSVRLTAHSDHLEADVLTIEANPGRRVPELQ